MGGEEGRKDGKVEGDMIVFNVRCVFVGFLAHAVVCDSLLNYILLENQDST